MNLINNIIIIILFEFAIFILKVKFFFYFTFCSMRFGFLVYFDYLAYKIYVVVVMCYYCE